MGNYSDSSEDKLIKFKKRAARVILNKNLEMPSAGLFTESQWMTLPVCCQKALSIKTFKSR